MIRRPVARGSNVPACPTFLHLIKNFNFLTTSKEVQIAVLIERYYKNFPLNPDYKGLELSTSETEHVEVKLDGSPKVLIK